MRPDQIVLGELQGEESWTLREALNTGHGGTLKNIHVDTARKAVDRLAIMIMAAGLSKGLEEVKRYREGSVDLVVQLSRQSGQRGMAEVGCVGGVERTWGSHSSCRLHLSTLPGDLPRWDRAAPRGRE